VQYVLATAAGKGAAAIAHGSCSCDLVKACPQVHLLQLRWSRVCHYDISVLPCVLFFICVTGCCCPSGTLYNMSTTQSPGSWLSRKECDTRSLLPAADIAGS
jgi:hypothetical protein